MKFPLILDLCAPPSPVCTMRSLAKAMTHNNEASLKELFLRLASIDDLDRRFALDASRDAIACNVPSKNGAIDIICAHRRNRHTVVTVRNGDLGQAHIFHALALTCLHAAVVDVRKAAPARAMKALVWTATGNSRVDRQLSRACDDAGVLPIVWPVFTDCMEKIKLELLTLSAQFSPSSPAQTGTPA